MQSEQTLNGTAQSPKAHATSCWLVLIKHCQDGRCNCHLDLYGSVHILKGCAVGRMLHDEYLLALISVKRARELACQKKALAGQPLEAGDMGSTLEDVRP